VVGGAELCSGVAVGLGEPGGVLVGGAEGAGGCSWQTGSWSPTCWISCSLEEELLGALGGAGGPE